MKDWNIWSILVTNQKVLNPQGSSNYFGLRPGSWEVWTRMLCCPLSSVPNSNCQRSSTTKMEQNGTNLLYFLISLFCNCCCLLLDIFLSYWWNWCRQGHLSSYCSSSVIRSSCLTPILCTLVATCGSTFPWSKFCLEVGGRLVVVAGWCLE